MVRDGGGRRLMASIGAEQQPSGSTPSMKLDDLQQQSYCTDVNKETCVQGTLSRLLFSNCQSMA